MPVNGGLAREAVRGTRLPLTPEEIRNQRFPIVLRGYEKDDVDVYLQRIAADYEAAISAIASAADPYASLGREVGAVLRSAKESAESLRLDADEEARLIRQKAGDEAMEMRRRSAEEAAGTLEAAREKALKLSQEAERLVAAAQEEARLAREKAAEETAEMRRRAADEASATLDAASQEAEVLRSDAERQARELRGETERRCEDLLRGATDRHHELQALERQLEERINGVESAFERLRAELGSAVTEGAGSVAARRASEDPATSRALADRLKSLDPELDQVASAVEEDGGGGEAEESRRSVAVDEPKEAADSGRGESR
jgi:DivIVA domain-containing protein